MGQRGKGKGRVPRLGSTSSSILWDVEGIPTPIRTNTCSRARAFASTSLHRASSCIYHYFLELQYDFDLYDRDNLRLAWCDREGKGEQSGDQARDGEKSSTGSWKPARGCSKRSLRYRVLPPCCCAGQIRGTGIPTRLLAFKKPSSDILNQRHNRLR